MELVPGGSLDALIKSRKQLSWEETLDFGLQIAQALEHAHAAGIIHRDLKPANLLLGAKNVLKLSDFGIARDTEATALTQAGKTVGTMNYMAPEQISGKQPISRRTDLYALGCVMFEMLTGRVPFEAKTTPEVMFKHLELDTPSVREIAWQTPIWLAELIEELLEKNPEDRPYDALAVQTKLQDVRKKVAEQATVIGDSTRGGGSGVTMKGGAVVTRAQSQKKKKKRKAADPIWQRWWFMTACLIALIGGVTWAAWPPSESELYARVQATLQASGEDQIYKAEADLKRLASRFPEGEHAKEVTRWLEDIDAIQAEKNLETRLRFGKDPVTEGERLWVEAKQYERFGDRPTALERYDNMQKVLGNSPEDKPFRSLARRQGEKIRASLGGKTDRIAFVNEKLAEADRIFQEGSRLEAKEIWKGISKLYGSNSELEQQVMQAEDRLENAEKTLSRSEAPVGP
jgi:serine/threonine-protein kinase